MKAARIYAWNPRVRILNGRVPIPRRLNNFGDVLGPRVVKLALAEHGIGQESLRSPGPSLFSIGSVLHHADDGDVIWGSGVNGKIEDAAYRWQRLDIRAVRGPRTRAWVQDRYRIDVPEVYGDPALLLFRLGFPVPRPKKSRTMALVPNFRDDVRGLPQDALVNPRWPLERVVREIARSEYVVASSLHGFILAEMLGVPVALLSAATEPPFKYLDYVEGTGRKGIEIFDSVDDAARHARGITGESHGVLGGWSPEPLLDAFPTDLFRS